MCIGVFVCVHVCMMNTWHVCTYMPYVCMLRVRSVTVCVYMYGMSIYVCMYVCTYDFIYVCIYCVFVYMCIFSNICMYTYVFRNLLYCFKKFPANIFILKYLFVKLTALLKYLDLLKNFHVKKFHIIFAYKIYFTTNKLLYMHIYCMAQFIDGKKCYI